MDTTLNDHTHTIIGCAYTVSNTLGVGFLEKVFENATAHEIRKSGLSVVQQHPIAVNYDGIVVGQYFADLLVENQILVEIKVAKDLTDIHAAQCLNYLRATGFPICLLINFGRPKVQVKRILPYDNWDKNTN
ncbi:MAG: GxxExxY protein [Anaerolineales bacterium]|nr:GxxExxY protein [Chloroflexota bacterium]MBL7164174.1 GxxExxY protein [Anaerolineales bacterium]